MPDCSLDMSIGYTEIKKQTAYDLCELLPVVFEDTQKWNPTPHPLTPGVWQG